MNPQEIQQVRWSELEELSEICNKKIDQIEGILKLRAVIKEN